MWSEKYLEPKGKKEVECEISLLDLPEKILEGIFEFMSPVELCIMAQVCSFLKTRCKSDPLWEKHIKRKWGKVIGDAAHQEWKWHIASREIQNASSQNVQNGSLGSLTGVWPSLCIGSFLENCRVPGNSLSECSMMAWYICLEKGKFWFPAQVYRSGGLMLYCYDALLSYDSQTDMFKARNRNSGWPLIERNIQWERLRAAPGQNPHVLHVSECLDDLRPRDHIEVQWRSHKELPYDWWYAIIGHLESCKEDNRCRCHLSEMAMHPRSDSHTVLIQADMLMIEFRQYSPDSQHRRTLLSRKNQVEEAFGGGGFYGGIRKLQSDEIERWTQLWPLQRFRALQLIRLER